MGTSILLSFGLFIALAIVALCAFIALATLMRIVRERRRATASIPDHDQEHGQDHDREHVS